MEPAATAGSAASTPAPTSNETALPWPWPTVTLGRGVIHKALFPPNVTDNRLHSSGPLAVFTQPVTGDSRTPIWLADVATGSLRKVYIPPVAVTIFAPVISGQVIAWMEAQGSSAWRVKFMRLGANAPTTIASFQADTHQAGVIRLDGNDLAYVERGAPGHGDTIHLLSVTPLRPLRTIHLDQSVYQLALAGTGLLWSEGDVTPPPQLSVFDTSAWLSTAEDPAPHKITDDAFELGFDGRWMTWVRDPSQSGQGDQVLAMEIGQTAPFVLTPEPNPNTPGGLLRSIWPSVGDGIAAWSVERDEPDSLAVWSLGAPTPVLVAGTPAVAGTSIDSGWLVWNEGQAFGGARVSDILAAVSAAGIH